jgi:YidC/Oxa1 family membrane protein insertase
MDKKTILGIALIAVILIGWMIYSNSTYKQIPPEQKTEEVIKLDDEQTKETTKKEDNVSLQEKYGDLFLPFTNGEEQYIIVNTENYQAVFTNKGGALVRWRLKKYNKWDNVNVQLINYKENELYMKFTSIEAKKIDTRDLYFDVTGLEENTITLKGAEQKQLTFKLSFADGKELVKTITLYGNKYHIDQNIELNNLENYVKSGYALIWGHNLNYQEKNSVDESNYSNAIISMNGNIDDFDGTEETIETESYTGIIDFIALKTKYFTTAIIPQPWKKFDGTASVSGNMREVINKGNVKDYQVAINIPYKGGKQSNSFKIFIGPIEYDLVKSYGLEATVDLGWRFLIRPIAEYVMLPFFKLIHWFIPNYGIAIIVFSILMKILLTPLSLKQLRNASYMKLLQPEIEKSKQAAGDDKQKQQMATMEVYNKYGINPMNGCLPLLIQMPILFALWRTLNGFIDLRHQPFMGWITDLSAPDVLVNWGVSVLGMTQVSGLAVLMAVAMFIQQKMTITDPNQKMMVYMMPIMFLFMFSNFPSGLNLYYFVFNLLAIGQQIYMNKFSTKKMTLEQLKNNPKKKEGWLAKQMKAAQEMQKQTGKSLPPSMQRYIDSKNKQSSNNNKKNNQKNRKKK